MTILLGISTMANCVTCNSQYADATPFCPNCGSLPKQQARSSYLGSILFGAGLLALILVWQVASLPTMTTKDRPPVVPEPPDEAAALIASCGSPDLDRMSPSHDQVQTSTRSLVYKHARVKAVFTRDGSAAHGWKLQGMVNPSTLKPLTADKVAKRLPCANNGQKR
jgi:hypothetical protein